MPAEQVVTGGAGMDWLTFVVEMTKAGAWPLLIGVLAGVFRGPLLRILEALVGTLKRVEHLKLGILELKASLESTIEGLKESAEAKKVEAEKSDGEKKATLTAKAEAEERHARQIAAMLADLPPIVPAVAEEPEQSWIPLKNADEALRAIATNFGEERLGHMTANEVRRLELADLYGSGSGLGRARRSLSDVGFLHDGRLTVKAAEKLIRIAQRRLEIQGQYGLNPIFDRWSSSASPQRDQE